MSYLMKAARPNFPNSLYLFILFLVVGQGRSIRCFECNSSTDPKCADDIPPAYLSVDCSSLSPHLNLQHTLCRKTDQLIEISVNGSKYRSESIFSTICWLYLFNRIDSGSIVSVPAETRTIRSCGWIDSKYSNDCYQKSGYGGRQEVCSCTSDFCNSSSHMAISMVPIFASIVSISLTLYLRRWSTPETV